MNRHKKFNIGDIVSEDTFKWFQKLTLRQKLRCSEQQIKWLNTAKRLTCNGKNNYRRNNRKV